MQKELIFFRGNISRQVQQSFSDLDNIQMTCQTISNKDSFKITIRKGHVYIDIG